MAKGAGTSIGCKATVQNTAAATGDFGWKLGQNGFVDGNNFDLPNIKGLSKYFSAKVIASDASRVRLKVYDGVDTTYSPYHSGGGTAERLSIQHTFNTAATTCEVTLHIDTGSQITASVELFSLGESDVWVPYAGGGRFFVDTYQQSSSGNIAFSGCGFSPTAALMFNREGSAWSGLGMAFLGGATTTQKMIDAYLNEYNRIGATGNGSLRYGDLDSWDVDGVTVAWTTGNQESGTIILVEGCPI